MTHLDIAGNIAQILSVVVLIPTAIWKFFRYFEKRMNKQDERLARIEAQFYRNGGSSMKDDVVSIKTDLAKLTGRFDQHIEEME